MDKLEHTERFEYVEDGGSDPKKPKLEPTLCYKDEIFHDRGWCRVKQHNFPIEIYNDWGFCDTSCEHVEVYT